MSQSAGHEIEMTETIALSALILEVLIEGEWRNLGGPSQAGETGLCTQTPAWLWIQRLTPRI